MTNQGFINYIEGLKKNQTLVDGKEGRANLPYIGAKNLKGEPHGNGIMRYPDGSRYEGSWFNGTKEGKGIYYNFKGEKIEEEWHNEILIFGKGEFNIPGEGIYFGEMKNGLRHGHGKMVYSNSDCYTGEWKDGNILNFDVITLGVTTLLNGGIPGPILALKDEIIPIVASNHCTTNDPPIFSLATKFGIGKIMAIGHEGMLVDENIMNYDNLKFLLNSFKWLNSIKKRVKIKNGWANFENMKILLKGLNSLGYIISSTYDQITASDLMDTDIILFGNDWNDNLPYSDTEIEIIKHFVEKGGSIFIAGLGWSWPGDLKNYPMNNLSNIFGFQYVCGYLSESSNSTYEGPLFKKIYPRIGSL